MFTKHFLRYTYRILARRSLEEKPLPNMKQFFLTDDQGKQLSFWNDLPMNLQRNFVNVCIEIPKEECAKFEVTKNIKNHPLMQDTQKRQSSSERQLRYYAQYPLFNYGFIPQTWEQNLAQDPSGYRGDNDPLDICDLSDSPKTIGQFFRAKVIGSFCLIDQGEVDWKIFVVDEQEAKRRGIQSYHFYPKEKLQAILNWFRTIKVYDGKPKNEIGYGQTIFGPKDSVVKIRQNHMSWRKLMCSKEEEYVKLREQFQVEGVTLPPITWKH